jgi:hypothetical protein
MSPEWQRRAVAIALTVIFTAIARKIEPTLARATGLEGVWITRICAVAILIVCFKLTDMIPDYEWRMKRPWLPRPIHAMIAVVSGLMLAALYGAAY